MIARKIRFNPNTNWEKLKDEKEAFTYNKKNEELSNNIKKNTSLSEIAGILSQATIEICGKKTRHIAVHGRWVGKEDELAKIHSDISKAVTARNEALSQHLPEYILMRKKRDLKTARVNMKKRLKQLERDWWDKILAECQAANEKVDMGSKYEILRQTQAPQSLPLSSRNTSKKSQRIDMGRTPPFYSVQYTK